MLPALGFHIGAANDSAKFVNMRLNAMLMRSVGRSLEGTWCRSQDGKNTMRPGLVSVTAALAVTRLSLVRGMIITGRGS